MRAAHPGVPVVTYVNSSADVKAESDVCCTSSNAVQVAEWAAAEWGTDRVIVIPDEYLARNVAAQTTLRVITWAGRCEVHARFSAGDIAGLRKAYPGAVVLAHPECPPEVLQAADFAGSTAALGDWVVQHAPAKVVLLTECSMSDNVAAMSPATEFVRPCNLCPHMKRITLENIYDALRLLQHEVEVPADRATRASCHRAHAGAARYGASARIRHRSTVGLGGTRRSSVTLDETAISWSSARVLRGFISRSSWRRVVASCCRPRRSVRRQRVPGRKVASPRRSVLPTVQNSMLPTRSPPGQVWSIPPWRC